MYGRLNMRAPTGMIAATILGVSILCWSAFLHRLPLVSRDNGNSIGPAILHYTGRNAPPYHGIFLSATDWRITLGSPILTRSLIVAGLLSMMLSRFCLYVPARA